MWRLLRRTPSRSPQTSDMLQDFLRMSTEQSLFRFEGGEWRERWALFSDAEYGGRSTSSLEQATSSTAMWSGRTEVEIDSENAAVSPESGRRATKAGWCAMRADVSHDSFDLSDFHGIRMRLRPDARRYILNIRTFGILGGEDVDIFQAIVPPAPRPGEWCELRMPFSAFQLTSRGYIQANQNRAMHLGNLRHIGLLLADQTTGVFHLEMEEIEAFRFGEEEMARDGGVREMLQNNEDMGYNAA
jgi:NADH dehydrogenase [ubiquinone] 1 alpha subcomplex assembly factor 1